MHDVPIWQIAARRDVAPRRPYGISIEASVIANCRVRLHPVTATGATMVHAVLKALPVFDTQDGKEVPALVIARRRAAVLARRCVSPPVEKKVTSCDPTGFRIVREANA